MRGHVDCGVAACVRHAHHAQHFVCRGMSEWNSSIRRGDRTLKRRTCLQLRMVALSHLTDQRTSLHRPSRRVPPPQYPRPAAQRSLQSGPCGPTTRCARPPARSVGQRSISDAAPSGSARREGRREELPPRGAGTIFAGGARHLGGISGPTGTRAGGARHQRHASARRGLYVYVHVHQLALAHVFVFAVAAATAGRGLPLMRP